MGPTQVPTNGSLSFFKTHLYHGMADVVISLVCFAVVIDSLILILAGATLPSATNGASLFDAYDLVRNAISESPSTASLFAVALSSLANLLPSSPPRMYRNRFSKARRALNSTLRRNLSYLCAGNASVVWEPRAYSVPHTG
ncbi:hypothetical protein ARMGADRAFT_170312 [Armillaria gallica]|uniref:Uncharacterized protein n=1 Tax=Armillaria gallica TaxID=47427 RepID=A0A2H3DWM2_ARMGA|nr:hypothetical protein ARMGADRAFT_170312 [Armillaria gallica]